VQIPGLEDLTLQCAISRCNKSADEQFLIGAAFISAEPEPENAIKAVPAGSAPLSIATITRLAAHTAALSTPAATTPGAVADLGARIRHATGTSPTPTVLLELDHRINGMNGAFARLLRITASVELVGLPFEPVVKPVATPDRPLIQNGRVRVQYVRKDDTVVAVEQTTSTLRDASGTALFVLAIAEPMESAHAKATREAAGARRKRRATAKPNAKVDAPDDAGNDAAAAELKAALAKAHREAEIERIRRAMFA
jgi:PAS domain-containing protein